MVEKGWLQNKFETALNATTPLMNITPGFSPPSPQNPQPWSLLRAGGKGRNGL